MKKIVSVLCVLSFMLSMSMPVSATNDVLMNYRNRLETLNQELGTDYAIPNEADCADIGRDYSEVAEFYMSMTMDEFENYIRETFEQYGRGDENVKVECVQEEVQVNSLFRVAPTTKNLTQKLIFSNGNYFAFKTVTDSSEGNTRYLRCTGIAYSTTSYPGYKLNASKCSYAFNSDCTTATVNFNASLYLSENLMAATTAKNFTCKFRAIGGDIYELIEA